jgi:YVTN family beta-propeller protein
MLQPAGEHLALGDLPLGLDVTPDERYAAVVNSGAEQNVFIIDLKKRQIIDTLHIGNAWLGVRFFDGGKQLAISGGRSNAVFLFDFHQGQAVPAGVIKLGDSLSQQPVNVAGVDIAADQQILFAVGRADSTLYAYDLTLDTLRYKIKLPAEPYTCRAHPLRPEVFVSLWGGAQIAVIDRTEEKIVAFIPAGAHPNDMTFSPDVQRLFVANANDNNVLVIDVATRQVIETIITALHDDAPPGSTPNALAVSADGKQLFVAIADHNCLAVFEIALARGSRRQGYIPVGWYPTAVHTLRSPSTLLVTNGKGHSGFLTYLQGSNGHAADEKFDDTGKMYQGSLSFIPVPDAPTLRSYSEQVRRNSPFVQRWHQDFAGLTAPDNPIPRKIGEASPIKHIFYIIKGNRTFDEIFGDVPEGNGDHKLALFPEEVTPNHHALAREFVLLDNLYADAEVSADGREWSLTAYATDYVEKTWPDLFATADGAPLTERPKAIAASASGYIWDWCQRAKIDYRLYGVFTHHATADSNNTRVEARVASQFRHLLQIFRHDTLSDLAAGI